MNLKKNKTPTNREQFLLNYNLRLLTSKITEMFFPHIIKMKLEEKGESIYIKK